MRWTCPHCGIALGIADDKMNTSWSFSRCYQCGGYALVRKSEVNIIKVDRAPAGEKVLLPESSENPLLSEAAARNLSRYESDKPTIKPATRRNTVSKLITSPARTDNPLLQPEMVSEPAPAPSTQPFAPASLEAGRRPLAGPHAPAGASVDRSAMPSYMNGVNNVGMFPEPLPDVPMASNRIRFFPMAIGIAAAFALGSGLYLLMQSGELIEKSRPTLSDRHPESIRENDESSVSRAHASNNPNNPAATSSARIDSTSIAKVSHTQTAGYSDQVRSQAMAPERQPIPTAPQPVQLSRDNPPLIVQPKAKNIHLRSGPGMVYPVVGNADEKTKYVVTDWNDRWFKVLSQNSEEIAGWIRTDSVQVVPSQGTTSTN